MIRTFKMRFYCALFQMFKKFRVLLPRAKFNCNYNENMTIIWGVHVCIGALFIVDRCMCHNSLQNANCKRYKHQYRTAHSSAVNIYTTTKSINATPKAATVYCNYASRRI